MAYGQLGLLASPRRHRRGARLGGALRRAIRRVPSCTRRPDRARIDIAAALDWVVRCVALFAEFPHTATGPGRIYIAAALDWMVRCVALFAEFPHPATGPGPHHLARLTRTLGLPALEQSWQRCTGRPLPATVRTGVERMMREAGAG